MPARYGRTPGMVGFTVGLLLALFAGGCGESQEAQPAPTPTQEELARQDVCEARADIRRQVEELRALTPATVSADAVRQILRGIRSDLQTITDAQGDLSDERRSEIEAANDAFRAEIRSVGQTVLRSRSAEGAGVQVQEAIDRLASSYRETLGPIDCG